MLILTRRHGESVVCKLKNGDIITVKVINHAGNQIRLGFEAAKEVEINREEIYNKIEFKLNEEKQRIVV